MKGKKWGPGAPLLATLPSISLRSQILPPFTCFLVLMCPSVIPGTTQHTFVGIKMLYAHFYVLHVSFIWDGKRGSEYKKNIKNTYFSSTLRNFLKFFCGMLKILDIAVRGSVF